MHSPSPQVLLSTSVSLPSQVLPFSLSVINESPYPNGCQIRAFVIIEIRIAAPVRKHLTPAIRGAGSSGNRCEMLYTDSLS